MMVAGIALTLGTSGVSNAEKGELGALVSAAYDQNKPALTEAERDLIGSKCGYASGEWKGRNIRMHDGVLDCGNGRRVDDPEVRTIMAAFGKRVRAHVDSVMKRVEVRRAISREAAEASRKAMRDGHVAQVRAHARASADARAALDHADRARILSLRAEVAAARAHAIADAIDVDAIRRQVDEALERGLAPIDRDERP